MDNRSYIILYRFLNHHGDILQEVKYIDTPKSKKYQWFHIKPHSAPTPLTFLSQFCTTRIFKEGSLIIHPDYALFNDEIYDKRMPLLPIVQTTDFCFHGILPRI